MDNDFGAAIKVRRKELKLTQAELAEMLGVRQATVSKLETDGKPPGIDTMLDLAKVLRCRFVLHPDRSITLERV